MNLEEISVVCNLKYMKVKPLCQVHRKSIFNY